MRFLNYFDSGLVALAAQVLHSEEPFFVLSCFSGKLPLAQWCIRRPEAHANDKLTVVHNGREDFPTSCITRHSENQSHVKRLSTHALPLDLYQRLKPREVRPAFLKTFYASSSALTMSGIRRDKNVSI